MFRRRPISQRTDTLFPDTTLFRASAFLFPRGAVLREFPRGSSINWRALYDLKLRWKMSVRALIRRGHDLKLLTPAQYRTANIHLVKAGTAKVEKYDDDGKLPVEQPELLPSRSEERRGGKEGV